jgi:flagellar M-ring protein FliF
VLNLDQLTSRLKELSGQLSVKQQLSLIVTFLAVIGIVSGAAWWITRPTYALLFEEMDQTAASEVIAKLDAQKIDYKLDAGGRGIRVPSAQVDRLRLDLSAQGLPSSGRIGFEIFDRTAFGQTEFLEHVNYRRALEGEIARTIATIADVGGARVHIAMAKESLFGAREQPAKASVVLKLRRANHTISAATVSGIANLVAASVEGLKPEAVVVMDSFGQPLSRPSTDDSSPVGAGQMERQQRIERELGERVVALLAPVVGADRVRANVAVRLSPESEEQTEEKWDPTTAVVRSRQMTSDVSPTPASLGLASTGTGVAGARANLPAPAAAAKPAATTASAATTTPATPGPTQGTTPGATPVNAATRSSETTNYEISRTTRHTIKPGGDVARISVAVILDDEVVTKKDKAGKVTRNTKSRGPEELQKIQTLVATAVGLDTTRGDQVTVENIAFDSQIAEEPAEPSLVERYGPAAGEGAKVVAVIGLVLFVLMVIVRPVFKQALSGPALPGQALAPAIPGMPPRTVRDLEGEIEAQLASSAQQKQLESMKMPVLTKKVNTIVANEPEATAKLLRSWLNEGER